MAKEVNGLAALKTYVEQFETQKLAAGSLGISQAYLSDLLQANRDLTPQILKKLGLRRAVVQAKRSA
jgi:hypothetical protein